MSLNKVIKIDGPTKQKTEVLRCLCSNNEHILIVDKFSDDPIIYIHVHLTPHKWYKRIWKGIKYIFGHQSNYGEFQEILTTKQELQNLIDKL